MKQYVKPVVKLSGAAAVSASSCASAISQEDWQTIVEAFGKENEQNLLGVSESCAIPIEGYCKFSSVEFGNTAVFHS